MKIETYSGAPFVDREEEIEFFVDWFNSVPQRLLWVHGPKSSGKTTVISYVVDNYLLREKKKFWVKYFNLRQMLITTFDSFLDTFFLGMDKSESERGARVGINVFGFRSEVWERIKERKLNLFKVLIEELEKITKKGKKCIIAIDEIQKLRDVYIQKGNGERELLKEFLNLCVSLTKEKHLSHVVILTSNTVFIERIYNDARMKETSEFCKIEHLNYEKVREWLKIEGLKDGEIDLVWEYLGGSIPRILKMLDWYRKGINLKEYLKQEAWLAYTEIDEFLAEFNEEDTKFFLGVAEDIVKNGYFGIEGVKSDRRKFLQAWAEKEILFYNPMELRVTGNSRVYEKGMEILLERQKQ